MCRGNWKERGTTVSSSNVDHGDDEVDVVDDDRTKSSGASPKAVEQVTRVAVKGP